MSGAWRPRSASACSSARPGAQLTEAGSNYLPIVQDAFEILGSGTRALTGGDRGRRLMVTCNLAFSTFWLAPRLGGPAGGPSLAVAQPVDADLGSVAWRGRSGSGIRFGRAALMPGTAERLAVERAYPVCAPAAGPDMRRWETAPLFDTVGVTTNWEVWLSSQGLSLPRNRSVTLASTYVVAMTAALTGGGLAITHDSLAQDLLSDGRLKRPYAHSVELPEGLFPAGRAETRGNAGGAHFPSIGSRKSSRIPTGTGRPSGETRKAPTEGVPADVAICLTCSCTSGRLG